MKLACITQVRDECDIIELFVRLNSRVFDHIFIINNNSADATPVIIDKLKAEGFPISTTFSNDNTYDQARHSLQALRSVNGIGLYDWVLIIDADEFLDCTREQLIEALESTPKHLVPKLKWRSWVPTDINYHEHSAPLYSLFNALAVENHATYKAAIRRSQAGLITPSIGCHQLLLQGLALPDHDCGIRLNHFPVRSPDQITSKAILSHYRQITGMHKHSGPVQFFFQLQAIHRILEGNGFKIDKALLRHFAVCYNTAIPPTGNDPQIDSASGPGFGLETDVIQWPELALVNLGVRFNQHVGIMHQTITDLQRRLRIS